MWNIKTEKMCNQHLLGEHVEMHMFVGTLNKNKSIQEQYDDLKDTFGREYTDTRRTP